MNPAKLNDFETQARTLRYRALGTACRSLNIRSLLLAHHEDDLAESVLQNLLRLGSAPVSWRLRGIEHRATNIPECWGMYGVHSSGAIENKALSMDTACKSAPSKAEDGEVSSQCQSMVFEEGGISIVRPLLSFSKSRIRLTCQRHGLNWVEDDTNQDVTRTTRNAIRFLLQGQRLPRALSKDRLLVLHDRAKRKTRNIEDLGLELFQRAGLLNFDLRSGILTVRLPQWPPDDSLGIMAFLRRIFEIVSPKERIPISDLHTALDNMYSETPDSLSVSEDRKLNGYTNSFSTGGVHAQRREMPLRLSSDGSNPTNLDPDSIWMLTRQPFHRGKEPHPISIPATGCKALSHAYDQTITQGEIEDRCLEISEENEGRWSSWKLWDGRFWIRISNQTDQQLEVRAFTTKDLNISKPNLSKEESESLRRKLAVAAPGDVRYTLPIIAQTSKPRKVLAFPTLGHRLGSSSNDLEWEVRYKSVDYGHGRMGDWKYTRS